MSKGSRNRTKNFDAYRENYDRIHQVNPRKHLIPKVCPACAGLGEAFINNNYYEALSPCIVCGGSGEARGG